MRSVFCVLSAIETFSSEQPDSSGEVDAAVISVQSAAFASMGSASSLQSSLVGDNIRG